jgi:hypothetical protein
MPLVHPLTQALRLDSRVSGKCVRHIELFGRSSVSLMGQTPTLPSVSTERSFSRLDSYYPVTVYARIRRAEYSEKRLMAARSATS